MKGGGGYVRLSLSLLLIILIICTNTSRIKAATSTHKTISGSWNGSITESISEEEQLMESEVSQSLLQANYQATRYISYRALSEKQQYCSEGIYGNCLGALLVQKTARCTFYNRCKRGA
ncbi:hypothetical protein JCGZ_25578 [Jatropha curcas]|uniref:Uncharacterized protein n=1 Tax=Jatropha curcas TaxID=180498 RepID=A0A067JK83_JATCU|nr:hypothetical protein JCGZ_25578 [Jatropha curcas]